MKKYIRNANKILLEDFQRWIKYIRDFWYNQEDI